MLTVRDWMTADVISVDPAIPLKDVARLLAEHRMSGLPVVDHGRVVGIISEGDLVIKERGPDAVARRPFGRIIGESRATQAHLAKVEASTAGEAMSTPAIVIAPERPLVEAAAVMAERRINRLPVVENESLVGIITRADVVRAFARSDAEIAEEIRTAVLHRTLWLDPGVFDVSVTGGHATIRGRVERRSTAEMIERIPALIPGIVGVEADVSWDIDDQPAPGA